MKHFFRGLARIIIFSLISVFAVGYALGYKVNWEAKSIEQTGIIYLDSKMANFDAEIFVNDKKIDTQFPYREHHIFPGIYNIAIKKADYQEWNRMVRVDANKVSSFPNILMIKDKTTPVDAADYKNIALENKVVDKTLSIKRNELWRDDKYLNRFSDDIVSARNYPDNQHIVLQLGKSIVITEKDGNNLQNILTLDSNERLNYGFAEGGRILVYQEGGNSTKAVELFERKYAFSFWHSF